MLTYKSSLLISMLLIALLFTLTSAGFAEIGGQDQKQSEYLPKPVGGYDALMKRVEYPKVPLQAKIPGEVLAKITLDEKGNVSAVELLKNAGCGYDEAVVKAIKETKFDCCYPKGVQQVRQVTILFKFVPDAA